MEAIAQHFGAIQTAVQTQNGSQLAQLLSCLAPSTPLPPQVAGVVQNAQYAEDCAKHYCGEPWGPIAAKQTCARVALDRGETRKAYDNVVSAYNGFLNAIREESGWVAPLIRTLTFEARVIAERADSEISKRAKAANAHVAKPNETLRDVEKTLKKGFSACWTDRTGGPPGASKKRATLYVVSQLMKIYFKLNLLKLAQPLIRPVEASAGKALESNSVFPVGDVVSYRFFVGRLRMFEDRYEEAEAHLAYAFAHCRTTSRSNKRAILEFLLPVRLRSGRFPHPKLLEKHGLASMLPLVQAVKVGDLRTFNSELKRHQRALVKKGTFLLLEQSKILVYRNLFKKVFLVNEKQTQVKLQLFERALQCLGEPTDLAEVECVVANLIYRGYVKGYISHQKAVLVVSKKDPFPTAAVMKR